MQRRIMPLVAAALLLAATTARAQTPFPAPLPGGQAAPANASPFPPANGAPSAFPPAGAPSAFPATGAAPLGAIPGGPQAGPPPGGEACMKEFMPLRQDAEKKAAAIKAASQRKAPPDEACKLLASFDGAEVKMMQFMKANSARCGIPPQILAQLATGHGNTEKMKTMVCKVAEQRAKGGGAGPAAPSLSEALGAAAAIPETTTTKRNPTFDTLSGNVLAR
jgi:hypothetical protein